VPGRRLPPSLPLLFALFRFRFLAPFLPDPNVVIPQSWTERRQPEEMPLLARLLAPCGVICRWRAAMGISLDRLTETPRLPVGYSIISWDPTWLDRLGEIDCRSYEGTIDAALYGRYFRSARGSRRLWQEALSGRFGRFDPRRTLLLLRDGEPRGHLMASQRSSREGFVGNLAVLPEDRGGTGRALLLECLWRYRRAGFQFVSLAVTLENERALRLYQSLGFTVRYRFPVWARPVGGPPNRARE
jgi:ribosomal protein S18 acetylase RimI-like enzyme